VRAFLLFLLILSLDAVGNTLTMSPFATKRSYENDSRDEDRVDTAAEEKGVDGIADAPVMEEIDPAIAKRVRRKFDTHVVPLLAVLYLLAFLDRSNIG
jgi:hypothetical protein